MSHTPEGKAPVPFWLRRFAGLGSPASTSLRRLVLTTIQTPFVFLNRSICAAVIPGLVAQDDDVSFRFTASGFITAGCDWDCFQPITAAAGIGLASAPARSLAILETPTWKVSSHHPRPRGRFPMDVSQFVNFKLSTPHPGRLVDVSVVKDQGSVKPPPARTARCLRVGIHGIRSA